MKTVLETLKPGTRLTDEQVVERWGKIGFLDGVVDETVQLNLARTFETFARYLSENDKYEHWVQTIFPIVRRIITKLRLAQGKPRVYFETALNPVNFFNVASEIKMKKLFDWGDSIVREDGSCSVTVLQMVCKMSGTGLENETLDEFVKWFYSDEAGKVKDKINESLLQHIDFEADLVCVISLYFSDIPFGLKDQP